MNSLSYSGIVHHSGRSVAECGPVAREMGDVGGLSVYITQHSGLSAYLPIVTVTFWWSGMSLNVVTTRLAAASARSLPLMFACPLILCSIVRRPNFILYWSDITMAAISGLWRW